MELRQGRDVSNIVRVCVSVLFYGTRACTCNRNIEGLSGYVYPIPCTRYTDNICIILLKLHFDLPRRGRVKPLSDKFPVCIVRSSDWRACTKIFNFFRFF